MEVRGYSPRTCNKSYYIIFEQIRLYGRYPKPYFVGHIVDATHQVYKSLRGAVAEIAYIDACEYYLSGSFGNSSAYSVHSNGYRRTTALASGKRYGAVCAVIIASVLYFEEISGAVACRKYRFEKIVVSYICHLNSVELLFRLEAVHYLEYVELLFGSEHEVYTLYLFDFGRVYLSIAARNNHKCIRVGRQYFMYRLAALFICGIRYRTGIDDTHICLLSLACYRESVGNEQSAYIRSLGEIQFAAECVECYLFHRVFNTFFSDRKITLFSHIFSANTKERLIGLRLLSFCIFRLRSAHFLF